MSHHSPNRSVVSAALGLVALALAGCAFLPLDTETLRLRKAPADVIVKRAGPSGELLSGRIMPGLPENLVDAAVGDTLRPWLTPMERRLLAEASQGAAVAATGTTVPWQALDGFESPVAAGAAMPVSDVYHSLRGRICRDVRQSLRKSDAVEQQVTLCREDEGANLFVWVVAEGER